MRILIADANSRRAERVERSLALRWPDADYARTTEGCPTIEAAFRADVDLVVLDPRLPYAERRHLLRNLRRVSGLAIVLLLNEARDADRIELAKLGAIDYVVSPFSPVELVARAEAAMHLRRSEGPERAAEGPLRWSDGYLSIDFARCRAWVNRAPATLSPVEFRLLAHLALNADRYHSERALLRLVLGKDGATAAESLGVFLRRLREQIEPDPEVPRYLVEDREQGYRFVRVAPLGRTRWDVVPGPARTNRAGEEVARVLSFAARADRTPTLVKLAGRIRDAVLPPRADDPDDLVTPGRASLALVR